MAGAALQAVSAESSVPPAPLALAMGVASPQQLAQHYRQREQSHLKLTIDLAFTLARRFALPLAAKPWHEMSVLDAGCSIGTYAIEFAKVGAATVGLDADEASLHVARELSLEQGVRPSFVHADIAALTGPQRSEVRSFASLDVASSSAPSAAGFDMIVAFGLFERLHDDQLGIALSELRALLAPRGVLIFHSFPSEFEFIFVEREGTLAQALLPYAHLPAHEFARVVRSYAAWLDAEWIAQGSLPQRERIASVPCCNPTTPTRLAQTLARTGLHTLSLETAQLYPCDAPFGSPMLRSFAHQPITHRNIFGAACRA
jgi:SAM-dependent methyltransferase